MDLRFYLDEYIELAITQITVRSEDPIITVYGYDNNHKYMVSIKKDFLKHHSLSLDKDNKFSYKDSNVEIKMIY